MYKYKNVSDGEQVIVTPGDVRPRRVQKGQELVSSVALENPNLEYVGEVDDPGNGIVGVQQPQSTAITDAVSVEPTQEGNQ